MPGRLRRLSGDDVIRILVRWGLVLESQRGSHAKLKRSNPDGGTDVVVVPRHDELATGTLHGIVRKLSPIVGAAVVRRAFYTD